MNIALQGEAGSFHDEAAQRLFDGKGTILPCETFAEVFAALDRNVADKGLVAIENSLYGSINEVYDLIEAHDYTISAEIYLRIEQQLIGLPGAALDTITTVYSHPVALAQCESFLATALPQATAIHFPDTAGAVAHIKHIGDPRSAAIAGRAAARLHGLSVIDSDIEDNKANYTRFVAIGKQISACYDTNKASLVFATNHQPGSLARVLSLFAEAGVNLTKLQSRPIVGKVWKYRFYIDLEITHAQLHELLPQLENDLAYIKVLGEYRQAELGFGSE